MSNRAAATVFLLMVASACEGEPNDVSSWCEDCSLAKKLEPLREGATDCGSIQIAPEWIEDGGADSAVEDEAVLECVRDALQERSAFTVVLHRPGIDSAVQSAWAGTQDGRVYVLGYDSNVCGGVSGCTATCGPSVTRSVCEDPRVSTADVVLECADGEQIERCQPPGRR